VVSAMQMFFEDMDHETGSHRKLCAREMSVADQCLKRFSAIGSRASRRRSSVASS